jgi:hypothetical protein
MKKEMLISILVGLTFGLIITYGVYRARTSLSRTPETEPLLSSPAASPTTTNSGMLVLLTPEDETVQSTNDVSVTGTAPADSQVVVFINDTEYLTTADATGHFSIAATLEAGSNVITVYVVDEEGNIASEERVVIVSTSSLDGQNAASESAEKSE